jgi:predicted chitinase
MRASEIQSNKLVIFDIDDTLVHTQTKVHVIKDGHVVKSLNSHDFTHYKLQPGEEFDFGDFRDAREFFANAKPIIPMIDQLKQDIATGNKVVMVTARADFNDKELFLDTFRKYGVDMSKVHVYRAGNMTGKIQTEEKKKIIIRNLLDKGNYNKAIMYDDAVPNLKSFVELKKEYPHTKFYAWHVSLDGEASEYHRTNEGWKDVAAAGALATGLAFGGGAQAKPHDHSTAKPAAHHQVKKADTNIDKKLASIEKQVNKPDNIGTIALSDNVEKESTVEHEAKKQGIKGVELAQFMAQVRHESANFSTMKEFGGSLDFKKYDIKYNPAKAKALGNINPGDGARYKGRGFIQITGRGNYQAAGKAIGLPLEEHPELASRPAVAAKIAVWYWKTRVQPHVSNWNNTAEVTKPINPGLKGLQSRHEFFNNYKEILAMR